MSAARPLPTLVVAGALALGAAVSLGLARFAYALLLPPMRADLGWSYFVGGAMNTVNAAGYLLGALLAPPALKRFGARTVLVAASAATALALAAHGAVAGDGALYALRFVAGAVSAPSLVAGAVLAARLGSAPADAGRAVASSGLTLGLYYGGTGLGIVAAALLVPILSGGSGTHAWQPAWLGLGGLALAATALVALATRGRHAAAPGAVPAEHGRAEPFRWRPFAPGLLAYLLFGLGYIGYMTFVITLLREQQLAPALITSFYAMLGLAVIASSWLWAAMLQRFRGGESLAILSALLALATLLPVVSARPLAVFASGLLFGAVFLSLVTSTTALVRHNLAPALWPAGIAAFTIMFAAGQIVGPALVGVVAGRARGQRPRRACSAAVLALGALAAWRQKPLPLSR
jgi:predicted MFS family arabinose efflux permease